MASQLTIPEIIQIAKISQFLAANDTAATEKLYGGSLNLPLSKILYMERKAIEWMYGNNPSNPSLQGCANYVFALCGKYGIQAQNIISPPVPCISPSINVQPVSQTVSQGGNVTFTITASGSNLQYQWRKNGVNIIGANSSSYSITNVQSGDAADYSCVISNSCGTAISNNATLTVNTAISGQAYYGDTYYYDQLLLGIDNVPYNVSFPITTGQPFVVNFPSGAALNKYQVYKVPITEPIKNRWDNTISDGGPIPGFVFNAPLTIGTFRYYVSSEQLTIDYNQPMTLKTL